MNVEPERRMDIMKETELEKLKRVLEEEKARYLTSEYTDEMKQDYIDYAMSVIVARALPDVRDGLKPVHRRILWAMEELKNHPDKPHRKCARIVGDVLGKYHPHGDTAVYDALVRMAQDFRMGTILVDGHGNFGSVDGDGAAAMRYTEARLAPMAMEMLRDLDKNVVDYKENFDGTEKEPAVLPAKLPNLLINGSQGIAVGMATNIPPHNTSEVIDAVTAYIDNPKIDIEGLLEYIKGPDYPSGATIINKEEMLEFYRTGKGKVVMRPKMQIENAGYGRTNIVISEIPYTCSGGKTKMIADIIDRMNDKTLDDIVDVRDESSREGIRIVLEVKKGADIENEVLPAIYKKTKLQDQDSLNLLVLIDKEPKVINLKDYIGHYVEFQKDITKRKYEYLLRKAEERKEVLEGLVKATDVIDVIIEALRGSKEQKTVRDCLMFGKTENISFKTKKSEAIAKKFDFTERQTNAILDRRLLSLLSLEVEKLIQEFEAVKKEIQEYTEIITSEKKQLSVIKKYLKELRVKFDTPRKTEITTIMVKEYKKKFKEEDLYLVVDKFGYTKTVDITSIGRSSEDKISEFRCNILSKNTDKMAVFTNKGNLYQVKNTDIPKGKIKDKGVPIETLCGMSKNEYPIYITTSSLLKDTKAVFLSTSGLIKRTDCNEFESTRKIIASTKLENEDELLDIKIVEDGFDEVAVITKQGYILKFPIESIPMVKKASKGVKAIEMSVDNDIVDQLYLMPMKGSLIVDVNNKNVDLSKVKMKDRANKGIKA
jgi:Type IIA topoisomerase (DNA gyrase/topo II, topoisomerase IV), A subunit